MNLKKVPEILFLSNHGLVIGANTLEKVLYTTYLISDRLNSKINKQSLWFGSS